MKFPFAEISSKHKSIEKRISPNLYKYTPEKLLSLFEDAIINATIIERIISEKSIASKSKNIEKIYASIQNVIMLFLSKIACYSKARDKIEQLFYPISIYTSMYLMDNVYKQPSKEFRMAMHTRLRMPLLVSPWDSAKEIKYQLDGIIKRIELAKTFPNNLRLRYSSVPTKFVLEFLINESTTCRDLPTLNTFDKYWLSNKNWFKTHFALLKNCYPKYYRTLRDDRGDNTPDYIKRKLWLQACKQTLKIFAKTNSEKPDTGDTTISKLPAMWAYPCAPQ